MKPFVRAVLFLLLGLLLMVGVGEIFLRLLDPFGISYHAQMRSFFDPQHGAVRVTERGLRLKPNAQWNVGFPVATNSLGLRDRELAREKPDKEYRILLLGDSVVFGWGVREDETFGHLIEEELNRDRTDGKHVEVVNGSVPGWNGADEARFLEDTGLSFRPDLVLLLFIPDDVPRDAEPEEVRDRDRKQGRWGRFLFSPWFETFYLKQFLKHFYWLGLQDAGVLEETIGVRNFDKEPDARQAYRMILAEMVRMTRRNGARFALLDGLGRDYARAFAQELEIPYIVVLPGYDVTPPEYRISDVDGHPNPRCHRVMAANILAGLRDNGLTP
ncbi:MAG: SGNH/GDSL hydrolase family protein [Planctomycetota bacterium]